MVAGLDIFRTKYTLMSIVSHDANNSLSEETHTYFLYFLQGVFLMKWQDRSTSKSFSNWANSWTHIIYKGCNRCSSLHRTVADVFDDDDDDNWTQPFVATMWPN